MFKSFELPIIKLKERLQLIREYIDAIYPPKEDITSKLSRSQLSYNAIIISIYGCYESFVDDILYTYIDQIVNQSETFLELPTEIITNNLKLSYEFINSEQRFKNYRLKKEDVIENIYSGKITKKLLLKHSGNLSFNNLSDYFVSLGLTELANKIKKNQLFIKYFSESQRIDLKSAIAHLKSASPNTLFNILSDLISQRNSIAHTWESDEKVDFEIIRNDWLTFIETFCECLQEIIIQHYAKWLVSYNKLFTPNDFIIFGSSTVGFNNTKIIWHPNDKVIIKSSNELKVCTIDSAKIHSNSQVSIKINGCKLDKKQPDKYHFYFSKSLASNASTLLSESSPQILECSP